MRPFLHLLSVFMLTPILALASALLVFGHAISTRTWAGFFGVLLDTAAFLLPWGLLAGLAAFLLLLFGGLSPRFRRLTACCVAALALGSSGVLIVITASHGDAVSAGQWLFLAPALVSAAMAIWLAASEAPRHRAGA